MHTAFLEIKSKMVISVRGQILSSSTTENKGRETSHKIQYSGETSVQELNTQRLRGELSNFKADLVHKIYEKILMLTWWKQSALSTDCWESWTAWHVAWAGTSRCACSYFICWLNIKMLSRFWRVLPVNKVNFVSLTSVVQRNQNLIFSYLVAG